MHVGRQFGRGEKIDEEDEDERDHPDNADEPDAEIAEGNAVPALHMGMGVAQTDAGRE